jgi:hypothetical protein
MMVADCCMINKSILTISLVLLTTACVTKGEPGLVDAATQPLSDLNLIKKKIPQILQVSAAHPFSVPPNQDCVALRNDIDLLAQALGMNGSTAKKGIIEKGKDSAGNAAVNALRRTTEGIVPMRGWIRKLSGAERHSSLVANAISAGHLRRAYLKGYFEAKGCVEEVLPGERVPPGAKEGNRGIDG